MEILNKNIFYHFFLYLYSRDTISPIIIRTSIKFKVKKKKKYIYPTIFRIINFCKVWFNDSLSPNAFFYLNYKVLKCSFILKKKLLVAKKIKKFANKFRKKIHYRKFSNIFSVVQLNKKKMILWEFLTNFSSILPKNFLKKPNYGEKILDSFQLQENNFFFFLLLSFQTKKDYLEDFLKVFRNIFENSNFLSFFEHIDAALIVVFFKNLLKFFLKFSSLFPNNKKNIPNLIRFCPRIFQGINFLTKEKKNSDLKIFTSFKHGWGLFSSKSIERLAILKEYRGKKIKHSEEFLLEIFYRFTDQNLFFFQLNKENILDATFSGNPSRLINHSCDPICFSRCIKHGFKNSIIIVSLNKISCFEEISYDYKINSDEFENEEIPCFCFCIFCRKTLEIN